MFILSILSTYVYIYTHIFIHVASYVIIYIYIHIIILYIHAKLDAVPRFYWLIAVTVAWRSSPDSGLEKKPVWA